MTKTIFVYGFEGHRGQLKVAGKIFDDLIYFEYNSKLTQSLEEIAKDLGDFIDLKTKKKEKINLIGVSAGGIIADYCLKFVSPSKIYKLN